MQKDSIPKSKLLQALSDLSRELRGMKLMLLFPARLSWLACRSSPTLVAAELDGDHVPVKDAPVQPLDFVRDFVGPNKPVIINGKKRALLCVEAA